MILAIQFFWKKRCVCKLILGFILIFVQEECDKQSSKIFVEFKKRRGINDKVKCAGLKNKHGNNQYV